MVFFVMFRNFLIADNLSVSIFTYTGRLQLMPKYTGLNLQLSNLREKTVSLGPFYLAIRNMTEEGSTFIPADFLIVYQINVKLIIFCSNTCL